MRARNAEIEQSTARVKVERDRAFAVARNLEINASMARVATERARVLALNLTYCKSPDSTTPRCLAERQAFARARNVEIEQSMARVKAERDRAFAVARNLEINASMARVETERTRVLALNLTHCKTPDSTTPRCQAERAREFAQARNAEIELSMARAEEAREFSHARNTEIEVSMARVKAAREQQLALSLTHCKTADTQTPRCQAERERVFAQARNAEIEASLAKVLALRAEEKARNDEAARSMAAAKAERARRFAIARNAEIESSIGRVAAARARGDIIAYSDLAPLETGAINHHDMAPRVVFKPALRTASTLQPCREVRYLTSPIRFTNGSTTLDDGMKVELDRLALIARVCPAVQIEIHGHSDAAGPVQINRSISEKRAAAAVDYLVEAGVERKRITAIAHGAMEPMRPNTTEANRAMNRRVEITIIDPAMHTVAQRIMWDLAELLDPGYVPQLARLTP